MIRLTAEDFRSSGECRCERPKIVARSLPSTHLSIGVVTELPGLFLSYRRNDSLPVAGRLRDRLVEAFGEEEVFFDIDSIPLGENFVDAVRQTLTEVDTVIALIGPNWQPSRLSRENDYVRIELETALQLNLRVIPVCLDDTLMPTASELPASLEGLALRNAATLRQDPDFHTDTNRIIASVQAVRPDHEQRDRSAVGRRRTSASHDVQLATDAQAIGRATIGTAAVVTQLAVVWPLVAIWQGVSPGAGSSVRPPAIIAMILIAMDLVLSWVRNSPIYGRRSSFMKAWGLHILKLPMFPLLLLFSANENDPDLINGFWGAAALMVFGWIILSIGSWVLYLRCELAPQFDPR